MKPIYLLWLRVEEIVGNRQKVCADKQEKLKCKECRQARQRHIKPSVRVLMKTDQFKCFPRYSCFWSFSKTVTIFSKITCLGYIAATKASLPRMSQCTAMFRVSISYSSMSPLFNACCSYFCAILKVIRKCYEVQMCL